jgi:hypothetical protein
VDEAEPIPFPRAAGPSNEELESALSEVDAAIALVGGGAAVRIRLIGFALADAVAGLAAAHAQIAGVGFQLDRPEVSGAMAIIVGPLL